MKKQKSIFSNFIYNTLFTVLNLIFPIITIPYISRTIGAVGIGKVNFVTSIVNYFLMIASLGIPLYGVREIAKVRDNKEVLSKTFSEIFIINFISTLLCMLIYYSIIISIHNDKNLYIIAGMSLVLNIFNIDWFFKGLEEYKYITIRSICVKLISLMALFTIVKTKEDYVLYMLINVIAISGNNLINILSIRKFTKLTFKGLQIKKRISPISVLLSVQIAVNIYVNLDTTMCGIISGDASVGYYSNAMKIIRLITSIVTSIGVIMLPRLSYYIENNDRYKFEELIDKTLKVLLFISIPAMIGINFVAEQLIIILCGSEFIPSIMTIRILSLLIFILAVGNLFGTQILMPIGKEKFLLRSVLFGAGSNLLLNLIFIPKLNHNGAAIATIISELIVMIAQFKFCLKFVKIKINYKYISKLVLSNIIMIICLLIINRYVISPILSLILSVILGGLIYLISNIILKNEIISFIIHKIR